MDFLITNKKYNQEVQIRTIEQFDIYKILRLSSLLKKQKIKIKKYSSSMYTKNSHSAHFYKKN